MDQADRVDKVFRVDKARVGAAVVRAVASQPAGLIESKFAEKKMTESGAVHLPLFSSLMQITGT